MSSVTEENPNLDPRELALRAVNHISAMVAYWDCGQRCRFSNAAYRDWFGKTPEQMVGMTMQELLGPLHEKNLPHILGALRGEKQVFERRIPLPGGGARESIATYTPDVVDGKVRGFWAHVADVSVLREREAALERTIQERDLALAEVRTLHGLIPICSYCKNIRDEKKVWQQLETYISAHSDADFSHSICPDCMKKHHGDFVPDPGPA